MEEKDVYFGTSPLNVMDSLMVTLTLEDGSAQECEVIGVFSVDEKEYIAMFPVNQNDENNVFLFEFIEGENDTVEFVNIPTQEEYEAASAAFQKMIEEE